MKKKLFYCKYYLFQFYKNYYFNSTAFKLIKSDKDIYVTIGFYFK